MKRIVAGIVFAALAVGAALAADAFNPAWRTVFAGDKALELTRQCSRGAPGPISGTWTPSDAEIAALEPALVPLLAEQLKKRRYGVPAAEYYRQYGGLLIAGRRVIYVNAFHRSLLERRDSNGQIMPPSDTWRTQAMMICDGGPIVFGVEYDPATKTFAHFSFNGSV